MEKIEEIGERYGFVDSCEATAYRMTPTERAAWFNTSQGVPMLAFDLDGTFEEEDDNANPPE
jgi:hypothetical protein